ncbi:MAG: ArnT family glycosyltransferase [Thermoleophilia bacterium]
MILAIFALAGAILTLLSTREYGAGLNSDSIGYISVARSLLSGDGFTLYNGDPFIMWPPLYPVLLAFFSLISHTDAFPVARILNAVFFGAAIYAGGWLAFRCFSSRALAFAAIVAVLLSPPAFGVSTMVWSEMPFICLVMLSLVFSVLYLEKKEYAYLALLAISVSLAAMTRYIGITLIIWGALIIVAFQRVSLKRKVAQLVFFLTVSVLPVGLWMLRNHAVSGTFMGPRYSTIFTLHQNIARAFDAFLGWYAPAWAIDHRGLLLLTAVAMLLILGSDARDTWRLIKLKAVPIGSIALFVLIYTLFLIISASMTAFDLIGGRLLTPVYLPLTLLVIFVIQVALRSDRRYLPTRIFNTAMIFGVFLWLLFPLVSMQSQAGLEYNGDAWRGSQTIQYLLHDGAFVSDYPIYSNAPEAVYMLADMKAKNSPARLKHFYSTETALPLTAVRDQWPPGDRAYLIWFIYPDARGFLYSINDLAEIVNLEPIAQFDDGVVFIVSRK